MRRWLAVGAVLSALTSAAWGQVAQEEIARGEVARKAAETGPSYAPRSIWFDAWDLSGYFAFDTRTFLEAASHPGQESGHGGSLVLKPELYREWDDGAKTLTIEPFARFDSADPERTHWDIRQLAWQRAWSRWELVAGASRVFWGVTESQHLVDVVNQTDLVEGPDGEEKLGQPMLRATSINSWGIVDAFILPGFRERTFPGVEGRLRLGIPIDTDSPSYEASSGQGHVDWALRWSHAIGPFDVGLSHFSGTSREPLLLLASADDESDLLVVPYYSQIDQTGFDAQATLGSWLWKVEAIHRSGFEVKNEHLTGGRLVPHDADFTATTAGFEFTLWGVFDSSVDIGVLGEHLWDERGALATTPFQDDIFAGTRIAFNDAQSTEILTGVIYDLDNASRLYLLEASRRIGSNWQVELEYRGFSGQRPLDPAASLRTDDYFQLSLRRHF